MLQPMSLLHASLSRPADRSVEASSIDAPMRPRDCVSAFVVFAVATVAALAVLGADWAAMTGEDGVRPLPEATRMMIIAPLPR